MTPKENESIIILNLWNKIISEVRANRKNLSARFNHDLDKLSEYFKKEQNKSKGKAKNFQAK